MRDADCKPEAIEKAGQNALATAESVAGNSILRAELRELSNVCANGQDQAMSIWAWVMAPGSTFTANSCSSPLGVSATVSFTTYTSGATRPATRSARYALRGIVVPSTSCARPARPSVTTPVWVQTKRSSAVARVALQVGARVRAASPRIDDRTFFTSAVDPRHLRSMQG